MLKIIFSVVIFTVVSQLTALAVYVLYRLYEDAIPKWWDNLDAWIEHNKKGQGKKLQRVEIKSYDISKYLLVNLEDKTIYKLSSNISKFDLPLDTDLQQLDEVHEYIKEIKAYRESTTTREIKDFAKDMET